MLDIWDLAVKKQLVTAGPYPDGQTLSFRIKVFNKGLKLHKISLSMIISQQDLCSLLQVIRHGQALRRQLQLRLPGL